MHRKDLNRVEKKKNLRRKWGNKADELQSEFNQKLIGGVREAELQKKGLNK